MLMLKTEQALDQLPSTILFNTILLTFSNLFLNRRHILWQSLMARNESQQLISKLCLGACSKFKMKQRGQPVLELQILVKQDPLLQTIWLVGFSSCCVLTGLHTLTFYFNVQSFSSDLSGTRESKTGTNRSKILYL